ncbi:fructokinase [Sodalis ligni]|uniref:fructokinase n=1 Tax=Sodalis ligni TaxID=2697027 RepID=A0A4R1NEU4_9GAMM|nr:fructokinase [Sodalis ligni]
MLGAIEAGGTKFVCAVSDGDFSSIDRIIIPTQEPADTMAGVYAFFQQYAITALGVGCFGPIDLDPGSSMYGFIRSTPKLAWRDFNILGAIRDRFNIPIAFNTDVNVAAYGELQRGAAARGINSCIYITVGTGIGGGVIIDKHIINAVNHPELGHISVKRYPTDSFAGSCPYHKDCLEGLAAGPSLAERCQGDPRHLPANHALWHMEAYYLAQAIVNYTLVLSPDKIIIGGGVMQQPRLMAMIKKSFMEQMNGYVNIKDVDNYIVSPQLKNDAAIIGGLIMAQELVGNGNCHRAPAERRSLSHDG